MAALLVAAIATRLMVDAPNDSTILFVSSCVMDNLLNIEQIKTQVYYSKATTEFRVTKNTELQNTGFEPYSSASVFLCT